MANPVKMSRTPVEPERLAPDLGEHSRDVLREAGYDDAKIDKMVAAKVLRDGAAPKA